MSFTFRANVLLLVCLLAHSSALGQSSQPNPTQIEAQLKRAVEEAPEKFAPNHNLGEFYLRQNNLSAAIPHLLKAQQLDPAHYANSYDLALAYLLLGKSTEARVQIRQTLAMAKTAELYQLLGEVEEKAGDVQSAAAAYYQAAQIEASEKNLLSLGNLLIKSSNYDEAIKFLDYGLAQYPRSAQLKIALGIAQYSKGRYSEAVKTLCDAVDLEPGDERPYLFLGEMAGVSTEMTGEIVKRMAQFVKYHPKNAMAYYYYAINLRWQQENRMNEDERIETLLKTAVKLDPKLSQAHFELGNYYADRQEYAAAIQAFRTAVAINPGFEKAHYRLARAYQQTGQTALAIEEMGIFQRLKEDSSSRGTRP